MIVTLTALVCPCRAMRSCCCPAMLQRLFLPAAAAETICDTTASGVCCFLCTGATTLWHYLVLLAGGFDAVCCKIAFVLLQVPGIQQLCAEPPGSRGRTKVLQPCICWPLNTAGGGTAGQERLQEAWPDSGLLLGSRPKVCIRMHENMAQGSKFLVMATKGAMSAAWP